MMAATVIRSSMPHRYLVATRSVCGAHPAAHHRARAAQGGVRRQAHMGRKVQRPGVTLPSMKTTHYSAALALIIAACGTVDISADVSDPEGTGSTGGDSSSSGESSTSEESLPVATPTAALGLHPFPCTPVLEQLQGGGEELYQCQCGGVQINPKACGCYIANEACDCDGEIVDPVACFTCAWDPYDPDDCFCGETLAPPEFCR